MNTQEIVPGANGTVAQYIVTALAFILVILWVLGAVQSRYIFPAGTTFWRRLGWPLLFVYRFYALCLY